MNKFDKEVNALFMSELGFEIGKNQRIFDQDTGLPLEVGGVKFVAPDCYGGKQSAEFDPYNSRKQMSQFFGYFMDKQADETGKEIMSYYAIDDRKGNKGRIQCKFDDNTVITSGSYMRDSLKYIDIVMQINGDECPDLEKYDIAPEVPTVEKKTTTKSKKTGDSNGIQSNSKAAKNSK